MALYYKNIYKATFKERPNRFIANVLLNGKAETVHVKNTGRCRELLVEDAEVFLEKSDNPARKTGYDLIAVKKNGRLINMDSQIPNAAAYEFVKNGGLGIDFSFLKREVKRKDSRFDIYGKDQEDREYYIEVKGVTLERDDYAYFPDAPTERGRKHIYGLIDAVEEGAVGILLFIIQMDGIKGFYPNEETDPAFSEALKRAKKAGVMIKAFDCDITPQSINVKNEVPVII